MSIQFNLIIFFLFFSVVFAVNVEKRIILDEKIVRCENPNEVTELWVEMKPGPFPANRIGGLEGGHTVVATSSHDLEGVKVWGSHSALLEAVNLAYAKHMTLRLSPDMIWITIIQQIGAHIEKNAEKYRYLFVKHEGQKEVLACCSESETHDWEDVVNQFVNGMLCSTNTSLSILTNYPQFSTTTSVSLTAARISVMYAFQHYFKYRHDVACGIPEVVLEGTREDWANLVMLVRRLSEIELGLGDWFGTIDTILVQFVKTYDGLFVDTQFWSHIFTEETEYGCGPIYRLWSGWIISFYIYSADGFFIGNNFDIESRDIPHSFVSVPFDNVFDIDWNYHLYGGMQSVGYFPDGSIGPIIQWAVTKTKKHTEMEHRKNIWKTWVDAYSDRNPYDEEEEEEEDEEDWAPDQNTTDE